MVKRLKWRSGLWNKFSLFHWENITTAIKHCVSDFYGYLVSVNLQSKIFLIIYPRSSISFFCHYFTNYLTIVSILNVPYSVFSSFPTVYIVVYIWGTLLIFNWRKNWGWFCVFNEISCAKYWRTPMGILPFTPYRFTCSTKQLKKVILSLNIFLILVVHHQQHFWNEDRMKNALDMKISYDGK